MLTQIKSQKYVSDFGEVHIAQKQIDDMLSLILVDVVCEWNKTDETEK